MKFHILFVLFIMILFNSLIYAENPDSINSNIKSKFEPLPIGYYDTNDGFGFGAKAFFLNFLDKNESFDVLLVRSTKGFQKYTGARALHEGFRW